MADRIVVLHEGGVAQVGPPKELYADPVSRFVASFIGSPEINLFEARTGGPDAAFVVSEDGIRLPLARPIDAPEGQAVTYGIRPQTIALSDEGLPAEVTLVEPTGETVDAKLRLGKTEITAVLPDAAGLAPGDRVHLDFAADRALVFDGATGARLA